MISAARAATLRTFASAPAPRASGTVWRWAGRAAAAAITVLRRDGIAAPRAEAKPHTVRLWGREWQDEYAWLAGNSGEGPGTAVLQHLRAENAYADAVLAPTRQLQRAMLEEMWRQEEYASVSCQTTLHGHTYYTRVSAGGEQVDCRRRCLDNGTLGPEEAVVDRGWLRRALQVPHTPLTIGSLKMSPDGRRAAFTVDTTGCERHMLVVLQYDGRDFRSIVDRLPDVCNFEWSADSQYLAYTTPDHMRRPSRLLVHRVADTFASTSLSPFSGPAATATAIRSAASAASGDAGASEADWEIFSEADQRYFLDVGKTKDESFLTVNLNSKRSSEVWVLRASELGSGREAKLMTRLCARGEASYFVEHRGAHFYVVTNAGGAHNFKVIRAAEDRPEMEHWQDFVAESTASLVDAELFEDYCVTCVRAMPAPCARCHLCCLIFSWLAILMLENASAFMHLLPPDAVQEPCRPPAGLLSLTRPIAYPSLSLFVC